jgi:magnesium-transporting ATPase (P-type)
MILPALEVTCSLRERRVASMSNWHSMEVDHVLNELNTDPHQGLSAEEARSRLVKCGYNELKREEQHQPLFRGPRKEKNIPITILLIVAMLSVLVPLIFCISIPACLKNWFRIIG